jgi:GT2 family glycosyltransferase
VGAAGAMITLAAPCIRHYNLAAKLFESAERGSAKPDKYVLIDTGTHFKTSGVVLPTNAEVHNFGKNIGVAAAWNAIYRMYPDWVIISNDDVEMHERTIAELVHAAETTDAEFIFPNQPGNMFCVFLMKHSVIAKIGTFDERFWPAYFEDNDYHRRMQFAGIKELKVDVHYDHIGSASLKALSGAEMKAHHDQFRKNQKYYVHKWGGLPGHETLTKPRT